MSETACRDGGGSPCGTACCSPSEDCVSGACAPACDRPRCGPSRACCVSGEVCHLSESCCPEARACPGGCCGPEEVCAEGLCRRDCADGRLGCGVDGTCCGPSEVCYQGACVTPGDACTPVAACATRPELRSCSNEQVCDPELGRCVPRLVDETCTFVPPPGVFEPRPLFTWGRRRPRPCSTAADCQTGERCSNGTCEITWPHVEPEVLPDHFQVTSIPMVADLDGDCVPEIVLNTYAGSSFTSDGVLRAIRGDTGAPVWTVSDPAYRTDSTANPAIGDVDGDGDPEIFVSGPGRTIYRIASDGTPVWASDAYMGPEGSGSVTLANLDAEGNAEIVFGAAVFDADGRLIFEGRAGAGFAGQGPISCVADLDGDGRPEIVAGRTVYETSGSVSAGTFSGAERISASTPDGYCGIADLDGDGAPEVVLVADGTIYALQGQTLSVLASVDIPGGGQGGAPNLADFDGDGRPDIGTAGASNYVVARYDLSGPRLELLWRARTEDDSSSRTGSSVFDFDGDGRSEVVYNDEEFLRIYPGVEPDCRETPPGPDCDTEMTDAEILFRDLNSSRTRTEYPVIADVDGDFKAEIVFATSNEASFLDPALLGDAGIEVWADRLDNWVATRPVWNQHAYTITGAGFRAQIPTQAEPSWRPGYNAFRRNDQGDRDALCAPDLALRSIEHDASACPEVVLTLILENRGCLPVTAGVEVQVTNMAGEVFATVATGEALGPGEARQLSVRRREGLFFSATLQATVDPTDAFRECREENNGPLSVEVQCATGF